ncbi:hypothetical protein KC887_07540 [Candidatus Kaiserbacteria bacterium]|nr:hypothetical protein [Candidatus Kaiserbacteria bacterium]
MLEIIALIQCLDQSVEGTTLNQLSRIIAAMLTMTLDVRENWTIKTRLTTSHISLCLTVDSLECCASFYAGDCDG